MVFDSSKAARVVRAPGKRVGTLTPGGAGGEGFGHWCLHFCEAKISVSNGRTLCGKWKQENPLSVLLTSFGLIANMPCGLHFCKFKKVQAWTKYICLNIFGKRVFSQRLNQQSFFFEWLFWRSLPFKGETIYKKNIREKCVLIKSTTLTSIGTFLMQDPFLKRTLLKEGYKLQERCFQETGSLIFVTGTLTLQEQTTFESGTFF